MPLASWIFLFFFSLFLQWISIKGFVKLKATQEIYELSPERHQQKIGTPSLGGVGILVTIWASTLFLGFSLKTIWIISVFSVFAGIGLIDDLLSLFKKKNQGFSAKQKFLVQWICSAGLLWLFSSWMWPLTTTEWLFYSIVMVGSSNATNLTDGLDGLLAGCSLISLAGFVAYCTFSADVSTVKLCAVISIALVAFLFFNRHPAKIFMGDTGSLALGASFVAIAVSLDNIWIMIPLGAVYILETLSVIAQVTSFKYSGKRIFLMAPLHHHFELLGFSERAVVRLFWGLSASIVGVYFWLL